MTSQVKCDCGGKATWNHPEPGVGVAICDDCGWIVAFYYCPYIPKDLVKK